MLVFHGPTVQHEIAALGRGRHSRSGGAAGRDAECRERSGAGTRFGSIEKGKDATLLVVDGNPLQDIKATEAISFVMFKGERINRGGLFNSGVV